MKNISALVVCLALLGCCQNAPFNSPQSEAPITSMLSVPSILVSVEQEYTKRAKLERYPDLKDENV